MKNEKIELLFIGSVVTLVILYFVFFTKPWLGFYYPNADDLTKSITSPKLKSYEACLEWVDNQRDANTLVEQLDDYECGKNCKLDTGLGIYVCKETKE